MNQLSLPSECFNRPIKIMLIGAGGSGSQIAMELFQMDSLINGVRVNFPILAEQSVDYIESNTIK